MEGTAFDSDPSLTWQSNMWICVNFVDVREEAQAKQVITDVVSEARSAVSAWNSGPALQRHEESFTARSIVKLRVLFRMGGLTHSTSVYANTRLLRVPCHATVRCESERSRSSARESCWTLMGPQI